jgi:hypothetical protein
MKTIPFVLTLKYKDFDGKDSPKVEATIANMLDVIEKKSNVNITVENDGIGMYEFWGAVGFDAGRDYPCINDADDFILTLKLGWFTALRCLLSGKLTQKSFETYVRDRIIDYVSRTETKCKPIGSDDEYDDGISMDLKLVMEKPSFKGGIFTCQLTWKDVDA